MRKYKLDYLYKESLLSENQKIHKNLVVDNDGTDIKEFERLSIIEKNIQQFVTNGHNILINSNICGNGKSS